MMTLSINWMPVDIVWAPKVTIYCDSPPSLCLMLPVWCGVSEL